ncbi:hypothetical protein CALCODRAFT_89107 [Calocera cornea HHB12733]|uniref:Uncharacterized protein n=1 Tax=Calocera cornea HHB12733 TaxID=1353952 RepID=A0A165DBY2_9BASI|nr:hypothetical protein CALCODRAFT_89107 [Calocera cornea HHB12733]
MTEADGGIRSLRAQVRVRVHHYCHPHQGITRRARTRTPSRPRTTRPAPPTPGLIKPALPPRLPRPLLPTAPPPPAPRTAPRLQHVLTRPAQKGKTEPSPQVARLPSCVTMPLCPDSTRERLLFEPYVVDRIHN